MCIFTGHHTLQKGWLGILDPRRGRQENQGAQLIAPVRETPAVRSTPTASPATSSSIPIR